ncbi:MAG: hypothetical protein PHU21_01750 [Elusimicrobia bacterium]|nr:hypothetical protein [Elusimicrobiota bacterium]
MLLLWIGLWLNTAFAAETPPVCVRKTAKAAYQEPADLKALLSCQKKRLARSESDYRARHGSAPSEAALERWREHQRGEARDYIRRHPDRSLIEGEPEPAERGPKAEPESAERSPKAGPRKSEAQMLPEQDLKTLQQHLLEKSDQGRKGITPEMAQEIIGTLQKQQGSVSPDMQELLKAVQKDGANLTGATFRRLQDAARQAESAGLDLGAPPDVKEALLHGDYESDEPPAVPRASGVN